MVMHQGITAAGWNGANLEAMLDVLRKLKVGQSRLGRRKLRLFACACCRGWWHELSSASREAVEITERYADGRATRSEFGRAQRMSTYDFGNGANLNTAEEAVDRFTVDGATNWLTSGAEISGFCIGQHLRAVARRRSSRRFAQESERQVALLHDVFGNPDDPPSIDRSWLEWNDGAIPRLAHEMYDDPDFADFPRLRRYLKRAGCDAPSILNHCSSRHRHVAGCWLLDALLGVHWPGRRQRRAK